MTILSPFRGVAVAAVACAVGTPGVQRVGRTPLRCCTGTARVACHCRHPATQRRCFCVPPCGAVLLWAGSGSVRGGRNTSGDASVFRRARAVDRGTPEYRNAAASPRGCVGRGSAAPAFCAAVLWVSLWWRAAVSSVAAAALRLFWAVAAVGGTAWLLEHRNAAAAVGRLRRHVPATPLFVWTSCCSRLLPFPCRGLCGRRFQPRWAWNPRYPEPRRLAASPFSRVPRLHPWSLSRPP